MVECKKGSRYRSSCIQLGVVECCSIGYVSRFTPINYKSFLGVFVTIFIVASIESVPTELLTIRLTT